MPSQEHEAIQKWFLDQAQWVNKEKIIVKHRADIILRDKIIIEIQCSKISVKNYKSRNEEYKAHNLYPIWVFGGYFYNRSRRKLRYGQRIHKVEKLEIERRGNTFFHNKYSLFKVGFEYKWAVSSDYDCDYKGWYRIEALTYSNFLKIVEQEMTEKNFLNWRANR